MQTFVVLLSIYVFSYDTFDPRPFGIGDAEAERIDPQQRHVLECVHMAFEDGGITRKTVNGSSTGVYIGNVGGHGFRLYRFLIIAFCIYFFILWKFQLK